MPATTRHGRGPSVGTPPVRSAPSATNAPSRARIWSRSSTSAPKDASTNSCRKMSRMAVRASTSDMPSSAISSPAMPPKRFERIIRRTMRVISTTVTTPASAGATRQPRLLVR